MRLFILCALLCAPLFADKIVTRYGTKFEGIVTKFAKDGDVVLATGYGDLTFSMADPNGKVPDVSEAILCDFSWPKGDEPKRSKEFDDWAGDAARSAIKWELVPETRDKNELDAADFASQLAATADKNKSVKKQEEALAAFIAKDAWCYVSVTVDFANAANGDVSVTLDEGRFDARTGKRVPIEQLKFMPALRASGNMTRAENDEANAKALKSQNESGEQQTGEMKLDRARARELSKGDVVVFKVRVALSGTNKLMWIYEPVRLLPRKAPIKK